MIFLVLDENDGSILYLVLDWSVIFDQESKSLNVILVTLMGSDGPTTSIMRKYRLGYFSFGGYLSVYIDSRAKWSGSLKRPARLNVRTYRSLRKLYQESYHRHITRFFHQDIIPLILFVHKDKEKEKKKYSKNGIYPYFSFHIRPLRCEVYYPILGAAECGGNRVIKKYVRKKVRKWKGKLVGCEGARKLPSRQAQ